MNFLHVFIISTIAVDVALCNVICKPEVTAECVEKWVTGFLKEKDEHYYASRMADYAYSVNMTKSNDAIKIKEDEIYNAWYLKQRETITAYVEELEAKKVKLNGLTDEVTMLLRIYKSSSSTGTKGGDKWTTLQKKQEKIYSSAQVCSKCLKEHGGLTCVGKGEQGPDDYLRQHQTAKDYSCTADVWEEWHDKTGRAIRPGFMKKWNHMKKIQAKQKDQTNPNVQEFILDYNMSDFAEHLVHMNEKIQPLYTHLHAYVRYKLSKAYTGKYSYEGLIPANVLGNLWGQVWGYIFDLINPFPEMSDMVNITRTMHSLHKMKKIDEYTLFHLADEFYQSMGLPKMTKEFWKYSVLKKPDDNRTMDCHGSAYDLSSPKDYRIILCTELNEFDYYTAHHEMGHIQYYMHMHHLPWYQRNSANPGFHEAIGDHIALSAVSQARLLDVGFLNYPSDMSEESRRKADLARLLRIALDKVPLLPFSLTVEQWRWRTNNFSVSEDQLNELWWTLRSGLQGLGPPVDRSEEDLDALNKYHLAYGMKYNEYFVSQVIQFQFYKGLCRESGYPANKPLHNCNFFGSKAAGKKLEKMLSMGSSRSWNDAMEVMTGQRNMEVDAILDYFKPLYEFLKEENEKNGVKVGWKIPKNVLAKTGFTVR